MYTHTQTRTEAQPAVIALHETRTQNISKHDKNTYVQRYLAAQQPVSEYKSLGGEIVYSGVEVKG